MTGRTLAISGAILALAGVALFSALRGGPGDPAAPRDPGSAPAPAPAAISTSGGPAREAVPAIPAEGATRAAESPDPATRPPIPGTERAHYEAYLARFRALGDDLDAAREEILPRFLAAETEPPERVAILRASDDSISPLRAELFLAALALPPPSEGTGAPSIPSFAIGYLGDRIAEDAVARQVLEGVLFDRRRPLEPELRRRGISRLIAASNGDELADLRPLLAPERDETLRLSIAAELATHPDRAAAERLARALGLELPPPGSEREE